MKKRICVGQLLARVKAGGKALENVPVTSPWRVQDFDGRPPGAPARHRSRSGEAGGSVMGEQKVLPSSLPEKRYPCSLQLVGLRRRFVSYILILKYICVTVIKNITLETYEMRLIADNKFLVNIKE
jgi:hypothetical protein